MVSSAKEYPFGHISVQWFHGYHLTHVPAALLWYQLVQGLGQRLPGRQQLHHSARVLLRQLQWQRWVWWLYACIHSRLSAATRDIHTREHHPARWYCFYHRAYTGAIVKLSIADSTFLMCFYDDHSNIEFCKKLSRKYLQLKWFLQIKTSVVKIF